MQASKSFESNFLKRFLLGLHQAGLPSQNMSPLERKRVVKLSSDVALASAREGSKWSTALITSLSKEEPSRTLVRSILGKDVQRRMGAVTPSFTCKKVQINLKRRCMMRRLKRRTPRSSLAIAKRMQKRRTQMLKALVPGGELMDELSFMEETIDYIVCLRAQVDVMQRLAFVFEKPSPK